MLLNDIEKALDSVWHNDLIEVSGAAVTCWLTNGNLVVMDRFMKAQLTFCVKYYYKNYDSCTAVRSFVSG